MPCHAVVVDVVLGCQQVQGLLLGTMIVGQLEGRRLLAIRPKGEGADVCALVDEEGDKFMLALFAHVLIGEVREAVVGAPGGVVQGSPPVGIGFMEQAVGSLQHTLEQIQVAADDGEMHQGAAGVVTCVEIGVGITQGGKVGGSGTNSGEMNGVAAGLVTRVRGCAETEQELHDWGSSVVASGGKGRPVEPADGVDIYRSSGRGGGVGNEALQDVKNSRLCLVAMHTGCQGAATGGLGG